jgi:glyoxylase-like metal-dependent hydrolase (beta-lactamase superfamily II)
MEPTYVQRHGFGRVGRIPTPTPFPVGDINSYAILPPPGSDELVLVDTGVKSKTAWAALEAGLKEFGFAIEDIRLVLLTHAHPDHYGQAARIQRTAGCPVWVHEDAEKSFDRYGQLPADRAEVVGFHFTRWGVPRENLPSRMGPPDASSYIEPLEPDRYLRDGDLVRIEGYDLEVVHTPGHCPEEVVFWQPEQRELLSGDHLLPDITPVTLLDVPATRTADRSRSLIRYNDSLTRVEQLPARRAFPSHGDVILNHRKLIAGYRLHQEKRKKRMLRSLQDGGLSPFELGRRMFPRVWRNQLHLVLSEVIGHLDVLESDGEVEVFEHEGVLRYRTRSRPG